MTNSTAASLPLSRCFKMPRVRRTPVSTAACPCAELRCHGTVQAEQAQAPPGPHPRSLRSLRKRCVTAWARAEAKDGLNLEITSHRSTPAELLHTWERRQERPGHLSAAAHQPAPTGCTAKTALLAIGSFSFP